MQNKKNSWSRLISALFEILKSVFAKDVLLSFAKTKAVKFLIKKIAMTAGWQVYLIGLLVDELFEHILQPAIEYGIREGKFKIDTIEGQARLERIKKAEAEGNETDYLNSIGDV